MPIKETIETDHSIIAIWAIQETENELLSMVDKRIFDATLFSKIKNDKKKKEWLASRVLLASILGLKDIQFNTLLKDNFGKPYLKDCIYNISISHTSNYCAVVISKNDFLGIDIESNFEKAYRIRTKFMNENELQMANENWKVAALIWSAKEAMYKAYGKKSLIFKEDMECKDFKEKTSKIEANLKKTNREVVLSYLENDEYVLTYIN